MILKSLDAELNDLEYFLDDETRLKIQKVIHCRQLDMLNEARDAAS